VRRFADLLARDGVTRGLIGPREVPRLWERHLVNCAALLPVAEDALATAARGGSAPRGPRVIDLGSGAGLPGIVLALLRPQWEVVLLEPLLRRCAFLEQAVGTLDLARVTVVRARAQDYRPRPAADLVVARAVAPVDRLVGWALPLLAPGGSLLALKGKGAAEELRVARAAVQVAGGVDSMVVAVPNSPSRVVRVRAGRGSAAASGIGSGVADD
jgi:16S rRNA (guanine527-N7)-methyltransferase